MIKKIFILLLLILCSFANAQSNGANRDEVQRQIEELMKAREEMFKSLLNDSGFQDFDKHFEDLMKNFEKSSFDQSSDMGGPVIGEYDWRETDIYQIFVLKVRQIKDKPLDIKIEKGQIKLKGDVESIDEDSSKKSKRISKVHFERTFSIPKDVDQTNPEFENKAGELLIKFKKLHVTKSVPKYKNTPPLNPSEERLPVGKTNDDISI